jgi:hypothetical protein
MTTKTITVRNARLSPQRNPTKIIFPLLEIEVPLKLRLMNTGKKMNTTVVQTVSLTWTIWYICISQKWGGRLS